MQSLHAQNSIMGSVVVGVAGSFSETDTTKRTFAQTFLLVPQEIGGFYVHNDFMMFLDADEPTKTLSVPEEVPDSPSSLLLKESGMFYIVSVRVIHVNFIKYVIKINHFFFRRS